MISVCDLEKVDGKIQVAGQRDFNIPGIGKGVIGEICYLLDCDVACKKCIVYRIFEDRGKEE